MTLGQIELDDIRALIELANRAPKSQTEQRWLLLLIQNVNRAKQEAENARQATEAES